MGEAYNGIQVEDVIFQRIANTSAEINQVETELNQAADAASNFNTNLNKPDDTISQKISSYEELCKVVGRYNQLVLKGMTEGQTLTDTDQDELRAIEDRFAATKGVLDNPDKYLSHAMAMNRGKGMLGDYNVDHLAEYFGIELPQSMQRAKQALQEYYDLIGQISSGAMSGSLTDIDIGAYGAKLDAAQNELRELAALEVIAADEMQRLEAAYASAKVDLDNAAALNLAGRVESRGYEDSLGGYEQGYNDAMANADYDQELIDYLEVENRSLKNEIESLKTKLTDPSQDSGMTADLSSEAANLESLRNAVHEVITAVDEKNAAFAAESEVVSGAVQKEIADLNNLKTAVEGVTGAVKDKTAAFQAEADAVAKGVKKEENVKKEPKQKQPKNTFAADKDKAKRSFDSYWNSLNTDFISEDDVNRLANMESRLKSITNSEDLDRWLHDWNAVTSEISQASNEMESLAKNSQNIKLKGIANSLEKSYKEAKIDPLNANEEEKGLYKRYSDIMAELNTYSQKGSSIVDDAKIKSLEEEAVQVKELINLYVQKRKVEAEAAAQAKANQKEKEAKDKAFLKTQKAEEDRMYRLFGAADNAGISNSTAGAEAIERTKNAWQELKVAQEAAAKNPNPVNIQEVGRLEAAYDQATASVKELITETNKLSKNAIWSTPIDASGLDRGGRISAIENAIKHQYGNDKVRFSGKSSDGYSIGYEVQNADKSWSQFTATMNQAGTVIAATNGKAKTLDGTLKGMIKGSLDKMKNAFQVFTGYDLFFRGIQEIRKGVQYITEIDTALTELKKVTNETDETYNQFLQTMSKTGAQIGATVSNLTTMAADWARLGYNIEEAGRLAESTAILLNVSEFTSAEDASSALISTMQAFGYAAEDSMHVVDVLNEIGKIIACR